VGRHESHEKETKTFFTLGRGKDAYTGMGKPKKKNPGMESKRSGQERFN